VRGIEIGNAESLDGLRSQWSQLTSRNGAVLGQLAPRYLIAADGSQSPFKLMAGPFKTTNEAVRACRALRARGVACKVGRYIGNAF
jgi:2-polyprenyl-6-methoxyphenol hydroxylase-like FAD-dependent oxidoreductase